MAAADVGAAAVFAARKAGLDASPAQSNSVPAALPSLVVRFINPPDAPLSLDGCPESIRESASKSFAGMVRDHLRRPVMVTAPNMPRGQTRERPAFLKANSSSGH